MYSQLCTITNVWVHKNKLQKHTKINHRIPMWWNQIISTNCQILRNFVAKPASFSHPHEHFLPFDMKLNEGKFFDSNSVLIHLSNSVHFASILHFVNIIWLRDNGNLEKSHNIRRRTSETCRKHLSSGIHLCTVSSILVSRRWWCYLWTTPLLKLHVKMKHL